MSVWIPITIAAAFVQNLRFMLQKHLAASGLTAVGATFARSFYAAPLVLAVMTLYMQARGLALPALSPRFFAYAGGGAIAQILATVCVVALFGARNFAVGIAFKKTETVQAALLGYFVLGEGISPLGGVAILIGLAGVILLADRPDTGSAKKVPPWARLCNRATALGLGAGLFFGFSAVGYRGALLGIHGSDLFLRVALTLACVTLFQSAVLAGWLRWRVPGEITRVVLNWRVTGLVGVASMIGSLGWFAAFSLQTAAYVKALGQIELVFSYLATRFVFHEKTTPREAVAMALIMLSILVLVVSL